MVQPTKQQQGRARKAGPKTTAARALPARSMPFEPNTGIIFGVFALVTIAFFSGHLFGDSWLWEDFVEQFYPFQVFAARSFSEGSIPFWNPYTYAGMPFLADLQNGFFYPGHLLMYALSGSELSVRLAQWIIVLHYFVAMVGMWRLAKEFGIGGWGRMFAGVAYGLSGMLVVHMIHPNMLYHMAFFPLIVAFTWRAIDARSWMHALLAGLTLGLVMLSGHPQMALYIIFFLFCVTLFHLVRDLRSSHPDRRRSVPVALGAAAVTVILAAAIFAIQYMPSQELADLSRRAELSYEESVDGKLGTGQLVTLVVPKFFGITDWRSYAGQTLEHPYWYHLEPGKGYYFWETAIYVGIVTLLLAVIGLASGRLGAAGWFIGGMAALGLFYALGDNFLVHPLLGRLPLFDTFRIPTRMAIYFALGAAVLAGLGLERVIRNDEVRASTMKAFYVAGGLIFLIGLLAVTKVLPSMFDAPPQVADLAAASGATVWLVTIPAFLACFFGLRRRLPANVLAAGLVLLCAVDLFAFGAALNTSPIDPQAPYVANDQAFASFKVDPPENIFRVQMRGIGEMMGAMLMKRNQGPYSRIMLVEGYNPLLLQRITPPMPTYEQSMALLNVKYAVAIDSARGRLAYVERPDEYPHAWMVYDARTVASGEQAEQVMKAGQIDPKTTAVVESEPSPKPAGSGTGSARITKYDSDEIDVAVQTDAAGILVLSEVWYPAWKAYVDGKETPVLRTNWSLRGVALPAGNHTVTFRFESSAFGTGRLITLIALVGAIVGIALLWFMGRKKGDGESVAPRGSETAGSEVAAA